MSHPWLVARTIILGLFVSMDTIFVCRFTLLPAYVSYFARITVFLCVNVNITSVSNISHLPFLVHGRL